MNRSSSFIFATLTMLLSIIGGDCCTEKKTTPTPTPTPTTTPQLANSDSVGEECRDPYREQQCLNGGTCRVIKIPISNTGIRRMCLCAEGWTGDRCDQRHIKEVDECKSNPCIHGSCQDKHKYEYELNDYTCTCDPGWKGRNCDIDGSLSFLKASCRKKRKEWVKNKKGPSANEIRVACNAQSSLINAQSSLSKLKELISDFGAGTVLRTQTENNRSCLTNTLALSVFRRFPPIYLENDPPSDLKDLVKYLLSECIDVNHKAGGTDGKDETALHGAGLCHYKNRKLCVKIVRWIVEVGGVIDALDVDGKTPLRRAIEWQNAAIVKEMIKLCASLVRAQYANKDLWKFNDAMKTDQIKKAIESGTKERRCKTVLPPTACLIESNHVKYMGYDNPVISVSTGEAGVPQCEEKCIDMFPKCKGFTLDRRNGQCFTKTKMDYLRIKQFNDFTSGICKAKPRVICTIRLNVKYTGVDWQQYSVSTGQAGVSECEQKCIDFYPDCQGFALDRKNGRCIAIYKLDENTNQGERFIPVDYTSGKCKDVDDCASNPCQHGNCVDMLVGYRCECSPGYTGTNCDEAIAVNSKSKLDPVVRASEEAATLGGPRIKQGLQGS